MDWHDLLAVPFERGGRTMRGMDCAGVAEEINARLGHVERGAFHFPIEWTEERSGESFEDFMAGAVDRFDYLGDRTEHARELGDFVVTDPDGKGLGAHITVLVDQLPRTFITVMAGRGNVRPVPERALFNVLSVHRVRREA